MSDLFRPLSQLLDGHPTTVRSVLARARYLRGIQDAIREHLAAPWSHSVRVANLRGRTLILYTDNASALNQMRFRTDELLAFLQERFGTSFRQIEIKLRPAAPS